MAGRRGGWRMWGAVLAAYLLVLQAALAGLTLGAHAAPAGPALFTDIFCSPSATQTSPDQSKHKAPPGCCVIGCAMSGAGAAPASETVFVAPQPLSAPVFRNIDAIDLIAPSPGRSPRATRAPPHAA